MDRVFSTRMDSSIITMIDFLSSSLHKSKKSIIEDSVRLYAVRKTISPENEILKESHGCWKRKESPVETCMNTRKKLNKSFSRFVS
jgi:hypothetical protein